jgi:predicted phosphodiesterase
VAIVSDTHGKLDPRVAAAVARHDCVIHAGDIGCAAVLNELSTRLDVRVAVRGNNDSPTKWPAADRNILARLADTARLRLPGGEVMVIHGHSHLRVIDREARPWIANPGAAGRTRAYGGPGLLSLTATSKMWRLRSIVFDPTWSAPTHNPGDRAYPDRGTRQSK